MFSTGSLLYTNQIFFNHKAKLIYITKSPSDTKDFWTHIINKKPLIIKQYNNNLDACLTPKRLTNLVNQIEKY